MIDFIDSLPGGITMLLISLAYIYYALKREPKEGESPEYKIRSILIALFFIGLSLLSIFSNI